MKLLHTADWHLGRYPAGLRVEQPFDRQLTAVNEQTYRIDPCLSRSVSRIKETASLYPAAYCRERTNLPN